MSELALQLIAEAKHLFFCVGNALLRHLRCKRGRGGGEQVIIFIFS